MLESYPKHPILTILQNIFVIISGFGFCFCAYSLICLFWLKPEDMNVEFTTMAAIVLGIAFVVCCPLAILVTKKGRRLVEQERAQAPKKFRDLREENKES